MTVAKSIVDVVRRLDRCSDEVDVIVVSTDAKLMVAGNDVYVALEGATESVVESTDDEKMDCVVVTGAWLVD